MNELTSIFKLLSDETRLRMLILLYQEELCVCEISGVLNVPQPRVSKNLSKLRDLNLVTDHRKEKFVYYSLVKNDSFFIQTLKQIAEQIDNYPELMVDKARLSFKDQYSNFCCASCD